MAGTLEYFLSRSAVPNATEQRAIQVFNITKSMIPTRPKVVTGIGNK